jgi:hypothetical protein
MSDAALVYEGGVVTVSTRGELEGDHVLWERAWAAHGAAVLFLGLSRATGGGMPGGLGPTEAAGWCARRAFEVLMGCGYARKKP